MTRAPPEQCQPQEFVREPSAYPTWSPSLNARSAPPRPPSLAPLPATSPSTYLPAWSSPAHRAPLRIPPPTAVPGRQEIRRSTPKQTNRRPPRDRKSPGFRDSSPDRTSRRNNRSRPNRSPWPSWPCATSLPPLGTDSPSPLCRSFPGSLSPQTSRDAHPCRAPHNRAPPKNPPHSPASHPHAAQSFGSLPAPAFSRPAISTATLGNSNHTKQPSRDAWPLAFPPPPRPVSSPKARRRFLRCETSAPRSSQKSAPSRYRLSSDSKLPCARDRTNPVPPARQTRAP